MVFAGIIIGLASPAVAGDRPDPILSGKPSGPCDPAPDGAVYVGGTDILGNPVAPANTGDDHSADALAAARDAHIVAVPVNRNRRDHNGRVYVELPGASDLLTPPANCAPQR